MTDPAIGSRLQPSTDMGINGYRQGLAAHDVLLRLERLPAGLRVIQRLVRHLADGKDHVPTAKQIPGPAACVVVPLEVQRRGRLGLDELGDEGLGYVLGCQMARDADRAVRWEAGWGLGA